MPEKENNNHRQIIETLADMNEAIGNRFDRVDEKLNDLRVRIDRLEQRVVGLEGGMEEVKQRLRGVENVLLEDIQRRVEALEQKVGTGK